MMAGATGPITKAISRRRSHRHQWRIFECIAMVLLDAWLVYESFVLAYDFRTYLISDKSFLAHTLAHTLNVLRNNFESGTATHHGILDSRNSPQFVVMQIGIVIGLVALFAFRGLYRLRLTGTWFRQAWTIISAAT
ncbi:MAG TPA: hypothetical protein DHW02_02735, partial [Ktedonobacter sp.]|nr:hypothetical protein [Ktedonobacter sp.]